MSKILLPLLLLILGIPQGSAQTMLSYLEKPTLSGIHIYQDSISKIYTIVAGSSELVPSATLIYPARAMAVPGVAIIRGCPPLRSCIFFVPLP